MSAPHEVTVAAVQVTPVLLDRDATLDCVVNWIAKAAAAGAQLVVLPEAIVPGYPDWIWRSNPWSEPAWYERLHDQAVVVPGPATEVIGAAAREAGVWVAVGVTERVASGTLYNSLLYFDPSGAVAGRHRKLMPTGAERTVWGQGGGGPFPVVEVGEARVGGLLCWENLMPLARAALYRQGVDVYVAPTWDNSPSWVSTLRHIAREGRCFVGGTNTCLRGSEVPRTLPDADRLYPPSNDDDWPSRGNTVIVGPDGEVIDGPLTETDGMLVATLDLRALTTARRHFDVVGHYARDDVFELTVRGRQDPVLPAGI